MMNKTCRYATVDDASWMGELAKQVGIAWTSEDYRQNIVSEHSLYIVNQAGFVGCHILLDEAELLTIAIYPQKQGQGYARALWSALLNEWSSKKVRRCFLEVRESNDRARCFYECVGFEQIALRKNYYVNPQEHACIYRWERA